MHPLFQFEQFATPITIHVYGVAIIASAILAVLASWWVATAQGLPRWPALGCLLAAVVSLPVGARSLHWATHRQLYLSEGLDPWAIRFSGFSLSGGVLLAGLVGLATCHLLRVDAWRLADAAAPGLGLGIAMARMGCFLNGCCFGRETALPWGVTFPAGSPAYLHQLASRPDVLFSGAQPVHPTQLYELVAGIAVAAASWWILQRKAPVGMAILTAALLLTISQWGNSSFRVRPLSDAMPTWGQTALFLGVIATLVGLISWRSCVSIRGTPALRFNFSNPIVGKKCEPRNRGDH